MIILYKTHHACDGVPTSAAGSQQASGIFLSRLGAAPPLLLGHRPRSPLQRLFWAALIATATLLLFGTLASCAPTSSNSSAPVCTPSAVGSAIDCDGDGVANATDAFPTDACAALDSDGDGQPDVLILPDDADDDACTTASSLTMDTDNDNDQVPNTTDAFPTDACAVLDSDADGQPDSLILPDAADDDACTTASALTEDMDDDNDLLPDATDAEPLIPALLALNTTMAYTASATGEHLFRLAITDPVADAYKIGIMETGSGADNSAANVTALTATTTSAVNGRTDHTSRLLRGGLTPITNPIAAVGSNVGVVYTFLPGDDATAATPAFTMLWGSYPTELAASLTYTIAVRAMAGTTYSLRVEKVTELIRLPSNIQTRARRGRCAEWLASSTAITANPIPLSPVDDSVTCDEGGPAANGHGFYLLYNAGTDADQRRIRLDSHMAASFDSRYFDTSPDDATDTDNDGLRDPTTFQYQLSQDCVSTTSTAGSFIPSDMEGTNRLLEGLSPSEFSEHIYCVEVTWSINSGNLASNNFQFTLNPPPPPVSP